MCENKFKFEKLAESLGINQVKSIQGLGKQKMIYKNVAIRVKYKRNHKIDVLIS